MDLKEVVIKKLGVDIDNYILKITIFDDIMTSARY